MILRTNQIFDELLEDLRIRGKHATVEETLKQACAKYDWILAQEDVGREVISVATQSRPPALINKDKWNGIHLVRSDKDSDSS